MKTSCASALVRLWLLSSLLLASASAATLYWDGSATTVNSQSDNATTAGQSWLNGGNWDSGSSSAPVASWTSGNAAVFGGTAASQTITAGSLAVGNLTFGQGPLGAGTSGTAYTISGGALTLSNSTITANTATTISATLTGTTGFIKSGTGTLTLGSANTLTGNFTISQGDLVVTRNTAITATNLTLGDANTGVNPIGFKVDNGVTATTTLTAINTTSFGSGAGPTITLNSGSGLTANSSALTCILNLAGNLPLAIKATNTGGHATAQDWSGSIVGTGVAAGRQSLVLDGTSHPLRLSFGTSATPNTFTGDVLVQGAVTTQGQTYNGNTASNQNIGFRFNNLTLASGSTWSVVWGGETIGALNGQGNVILNCQSALNNTGLTLGNTNASGSCSGSISGSFGLTKTGTGTQTLAGSNTFTGATTVDGGTLLITGSFAASPITVGVGATLGGTGTSAGATTINGALAPGVGGIGTLTVNNTVTLTASATTTMEIKSVAGIRTADKVQGVTNVTYGGTLTVTRDPASNDFASGDQFVLFGASTYAGTFSAINLPALTGGLIWDTSRLKLDGSIAAVTPGITSPPTFNPPGGSYSGAQTVTLTAAAGATIYYTTDGSQPTASSPHGLSPVSGIAIPADATRTINAYAATTGNANSQVMSATYITVATPTWITAGGGSWPVGANWQSGVVATGGIGMTADFSKVNLTSDAVVTLDGARTLGSLLFGDTVSSHNWTLATGTSGMLTLDTASGTPNIGVANQTATLSAVLAGTKGFVKNGDGMLILSAANPYSGITTVSAGTLEVLTRNGDGPYIVAQGATLKLGYTTGGGYANTGMGISGNGVSATTGLYLKGGSSYNVSGGMTIQTAPTTIRRYGTGDASIGMFDINDNGLTVQAAASGSVIDENIEIVSRGYGMSVSTVPGAATATGDLVINGPLNITLAQTGITLGFYKRGAGSVRLNGVANPDNMAVQVQAGTLIAGAEDAIRNNTGLGVSSGATLVLNGFNQTVGSLSGAGSIVGGAVPVAVLTVNQAVAKIFSGVIGGSGANDNNLALTKAGSATLTLSGANTYTGPTTVNGGILQASGAASTCFGTLSAVTVNNAATLDLNGTNQLIGSLAGTSTAAIVTLGTGTLTTGGNGTSTTYAGSLSGTGGLTKAGTGTQILAGACTHTGGTTVSAGKLLINGSVGSSPVTVAVGATLGGGGTLGRATTVNGTLAPGNNGVGALTVNNALTLAATSKALMEISKNGGTATFDRVLGVTTLTQGGTLTVTATGEALQVGDSFRLFAATTYNGAFATVNLPTSYVWDTSQLKTSGTIAVTAINHPPSFAGYAVATPYQKPVAILVRKLLAKASDPDGDALAVTATGPASANGGTAVVQGAGILYTPANNFSGADTFPVTITDARGATVVGTVTVTVGSGPSGGGLGANPPVLTPLPDGKMGLAFQGIPGRSYIVQRSASGLDNWVTLATIPADASGKVSYTDESPPPGSAFYRLGLP